MMLPYMYLLMTKLVNRNLCQSHAYSLRNICIVDSVNKKGHLYLPPVGN